MEILLFEILEIQKKDEIIHLLKVSELDVFGNNTNENVWIVPMTDINMISIIGFGKNTDKQNLNSTCINTDCNFYKIFISTRMLKLISAETF